MQGLGSVQRHTMLDLGGSITTLADESFCGKVNVILVSDADNDINAWNSVMSKEAVILCDSGSY